MATTAIRFLRVPAAPVLADLPGRLSPHLRCSPASAPKSLRLQPDLLSKATPTPTAPLRRAGPRPVHTWTFGTIDPGWGRPGRGWVPTDLPRGPKRLWFCLPRVLVPSIRRPATPGPFIRALRMCLKHRHRPLEGHAPGMPSKLFLTLRPGLRRARFQVLLHPRPASLHRVRWASSETTSSGAADFKALLH